MVRCSDLLLEYLEEIGVDYVFGIPGGAIEFLFRSLKNHKNVKTVISRHEAGSSFMADGYTKESGRLGVCCATTGPGATNLLTAVASAYTENVPQLVITAQTKLKNIGKHDFQDSSSNGIDTLSMFDKCTHYNSLVSHEDQFEFKLTSAIKTAFYKKGPVHLTFPSDILDKECLKKSYTLNIEDILSSHDNLYYKDEKLLNKVNDAENVVIYLGRGNVKLRDQVCSLAHKLCAPIVSSFDGKGMISTSNKLFAGVYGLAGHESASDVIKNSELIISFNNTFSFASSGMRNSNLLNSKLINVNDAYEFLLRTPEAQDCILANSVSVCKYLNENVRERPDKDKGCERLFSQKINNDCSLNNLVKPQILMNVLEKNFTSDCRIIVDNGNSMLWGNKYLNPKNDFEHLSVYGDATGYRNGIGYLCMGYAMGTAIGTCFANKNITSVCIIGDGSFLMNGHELTVAVQHNLSSVFIVLNDSCLGMVKHGSMARGEELENKISTVDFALLAIAEGARGYNIKNMGELLSFDYDSVKNNGPVLLDVLIDPNEISPVGLRVKSLDN